MTNIVTLDPTDEFDGRSPAGSQSPSYEPAAPPPGSGLRPHAEWRPLASLADVTQPWKALAARALEPNIFYEPAFALAAAPAFGRDIGAILVWSDTEPNRLVGFFPLRVERRRYGIPLPVLVGWTHPYAPFGAPLVDRDCAEGAIEAALDFVAGDAGLPDLLLLPFAPATGPFATALAVAVFKREGRIAWFAQHGRALLTPPLERADYLDRMGPPRKSKELRRQARRLAERGKLYVASTSEPSRINDALDAFLALEAKGWKGRARTAAALDPDVDHFMRRAVRGLASGGQARVDRLMLGDRVIAAAILLRSGSAGWFWKVTYDEELARASPGVQLALELTESLLADPTIGRVDSCATPDHPMIDHLWHDRLMLADQLIALAPRANRRFMLACGLEGMRRGAIDAAKWARNLVRR
jgi:CelD/BcsL family acetyltransferase involved in cellulose biosynthesis